jgi:hypothetical protein
LYGEDRRLSTKCGGGTVAAANPVGSKSRFTLNFGRSPFHAGKISLKREALSAARRAARPQDGQAGSGILNLRTVFQ